MTNAQKTLRFFTLIPESTKQEILDNIAHHYGISRDRALREVTREGAENLLDYVTGPLRTATYALWRHHSVEIERARTERDIMRDIQGVYSSLSPENLTCDGELDEEEVSRLQRHFQKRLDELFKEIGRSISEAEAFRVTRKP